MKYRGSSPKSAFTLLEMSIVIVIIGLIAGAVVVVQSYLRNAQLTTSMQEARYYMDAFNKFTNIYQQVPGDMSSASAVWSTAGDGDGNGAVHGNTANTNEYWYVWQHLAYAKLIQGNYTGTASGGTAVIGSNIPASAVDDVGFLIDYPDTTTGIVSGDALYFNGNYYHVLRMAGMTDTDTGIPANPYLTTEEAYELDAKFDDGKPGTGWVTTPKKAGLDNCADSSTTATAAYDVAYNAPACYFILKLQ